MASKSPKALLWILFIFSVVLLLGYNQWGVLESSEARYAEISREMLRSGDLLHPRLMGIFHYHKPPASYIITALGLKIFGINSLGARFFLMFAFLLQIYLVYKIARLLFGGYTKALASAIIYSSFPLVIISVMNLTTDAFLNSLELISIYFIIKYYKDKKINFLYWFYIFLSLAFLTKGPIGILIPLLVLTGCKIIYGAPNIKWKYHFLFAGLLFIIISFSWFIYLITENPEFFNYFLFRHTIQRVSDAGVFERAESWWYYIAFLPLLFMPWSAMFFKKLAEKTSRKKISQWRILLLFWLIIPLFIFSITSSKLILYILPVFPGIAIFCGWLFDELKSSELKFWSKTHLFIYLTISAGMLLSIFLVKDIQISVLMILLPLLIIICLIWINYSGKSFIIHKILLYSLIFSIGLILFSSVYIKNNELLANGTKPLAKFLKENKLSDRQIIVYDRRLPSLSFNLNKDIISIHDGGKSLNREILFEKNENWKNHLIEVEGADKDSLLFNILKYESVLISKNEPPEKILWISGSFNFSNKIGDWLIFYNK